MAQQACLKYPQIALDAQHIKRFFVRPGRVDQLHFLQKRRCGFSDFNQSLRRHGQLPGQALETQDCHLFLYGAFKFPA
jgi:hypothetical protein